MKKYILLLLALAIIPAMGFAQISSGWALFVKSPYLLGDVINVDISNVNQLSAGGMLRFKLGIFQAEGLMLFSLGEVNSLNVFLDAGVAIDIALVTLSFGIGPTFTNTFAESPLYQAGLNAKAQADIHLGTISVGAAYVMGLNIDRGIRFNTRYGLLGVYILFDL